MPRVRVITERDVRKASNAGTRELDVTGAVVTPSARDVAARVGVSLRDAKPASRTEGVSRGQSGHASSTASVGAPAARPPHTARTIAVGADHGGVAIRDAI